MEENLIYGISKVSPKGQVIIPAELRNKLGIKQGDQLAVGVNKEGDGILLLKMDVLNNLLKGTRYYE